MNRTFPSLAVLMFVMPTISMSAQVTLQPWVEVFGTTNGQQLGKYVTGITPSANLPFRAAVSQVGSTGIYRLNSPSDTSVQTAFFGENLLTGDLNNDGFKDIVVGKTVNNYDTVYIYWGTSAGIDTLNPLKIPGEHQNESFRAMLIGDINNDGVLDLVCTATGYPYPLGYGKVYFFLGPAVHSTPQDTLIGTGILDRLGGSCAFGDLNNDGLNDLIIRGWHNPPSGGSYDYINIYYGIAADTLNKEIGRRMTGYPLTSSGLACFDANGDGVADLLWTNRDSASANSYVSIHCGQAMFDSIPSLRLVNPGVANFGNLITNAGDMNGDGYMDIAVGAYRATITSGFVFVFGGGPNIDETFDAAGGLDVDADFGASVSTVGDVSGDGVSDIVVGAPAYSFQAGKGHWTILKGDSSILVTAVQGEEKIPAIVKLFEVYPNPFNPAARISYELSIAADISLEVFNALGQIVETLARGFQAPGFYESTFNAGGRASGVYFYRLTARTKDGRNVRQLKKMLLIR